MEHTLEITLGYLLTEGYLTGELTLDDGTGPKWLKMVWGWSWDCEGKSQSEESPQFSLQV